MASMSTENITLAAFQLGYEMFVKPNVIAFLTVSQLKTIITTIDNMFEALASTYTQNQSIAVNIHLALQSLGLNISVPDESKALQSWAIIKYVG